MTSTVMASMVNELLAINQKGSTAQEELTKESFQRWDQEFVFDALKAQRYGQSFCNYFGITDHILFYTRDMEKCKQMIRKRYLR
jgi:hypothetical protein